MTSKPTPGPWEIDTCRLGVRQKKSSLPICRLYGDQTMTEANARLIAAAPDTAAERDSLKAINAGLLAVLHEVREYMDQRADIADYNDETGHIPNEEMTLLIEVEEAIAKARGQS